MKKLSVALAILTVSFLIVSCSGGSGGDPKATLVAFFEALGKKDMEGARKLATADSKSMIDMIEMGMKMSKDNKDSKEMEKFDELKGIYEQIGYQVFLISLYRILKVLIF